MVQSSLQSHIPPSITGAYPIRAGNLVRPHVDGVPAFRRIAEAIEAAESSVWLTVAFYAPDFRFPDRGTLFDMLDGAAERGLDVRVLFWRPNEQSSTYGRTFSGSQTDRDVLRHRWSGFSARWDRALAGYVQHQKSWIIDAGHPSETAFVGGMNLTAAAMGSPGHRDGGRHDLYLEIMGPSATDVHHNFVQRWNEASERDRNDGTWGPNGNTNLVYPSQPSSHRGTGVVQIQRMVHRGQYYNNHPTPDFCPFDISLGEQSILEQYEKAIDAARSSIIIENQAIPVPAISRRLNAALARGVAVILIVPAEPEAWVRRKRQDPKQSALFDCIQELENYDKFALIGLVSGCEAEAKFIYVHAKIMLIDDAWATIGSCNLHYNSLSGHSEMNASVWDEGVVRALRRTLFMEHLDQDTSHVGDAEAVEIFQRVSLSNQACLEAGRLNFQGLAFRLRAADYGR